MTIPAGYAQITHVFDGPTVPRGACVVYGVDHGDVGTAAQIGLLAATAFGINVMPLLVDNTTMHLTKVKLGPDDTGPSADVITEGYAGGDATENGTPNQAYLVSKNTSLGGRRGKGRMFLPGVAENKVNLSGAIAAGTLVAFSAALDEFLADLQTSGIPMVLLHDAATVWELNSNGQPRRVPTGAAIPAPTPVTSLAINPVLATQRRRLR